MTTILWLLALLLGSPAPTSASVEASARRAMAWLLRPQGRRQLRLRWKATWRPSLARHSRRFKLSPAPSRRDLQTHLRWQRARLSRRIRRLFSPAVRPATWDFKRGPNTLQIELVVAPLGPSKLYKISSRASPKASYFWAIHVLWRLRLWGPGGRLRYTYFDRTRPSPRVGLRLYPIYGRPVAKSSAIYFAMVDSAQRAFFRRLSSHLALRRPGLWRRLRRTLQRTLTP